MRGARKGMAQRHASSPPTPGFHLRRGRAQDAAPLVAAMRAAVAAALKCAAVRALARWRAIVRDERMRREMDLHGRKLEGLYQRLQGAAQRLQQQAAAQAATESCVGSERSGSTILASPEAPGGGVVCGGAVGLLELEPLSAFPPELAPSVLDCTGTLHEQPLSAGGASECLSARSAASGTTGADTELDESEAEGRGDRAAHDHVKSEEEEKDDDEEEEEEEEDDRLAQIEAKLRAGFEKDAEVLPWVEENLRWLAWLFDQHSAGPVMNLQGWVAMCRELRLREAPCRVDQRTIVNVFRHRAVTAHGKLGLPPPQLVLALISVSLVVVDGNRELVMSRPTIASRLNLLLSNSAFQDSKVPPATASAAACMRSADAEAEALMRCLFKYYCSYGDKSNKRKLSFFKLQRWCRECGVLDLIKQSQGRVQEGDLSICFSTVAGLQRGKRTLNFEETRLVFSLLGQKLFFSERSQVFAQECYERIRVELIRKWRERQDEEGEPLR